MEIGNTKGLVPGSIEYDSFITKYINPRNIPPSVIEDAIMNTPAIRGRNGTFEHVSRNVKVIVNSLGDVITVFPNR